MEWSDISISILKARTPEVPRSFTHTRSDGDHTEKTYSRNALFRKISPRSQLSCTVVEAKASYYEGKSQIAIVSDQAHELKANEISLLIQNNDDVSVGSTLSAALLPAAAACCW